MSKSQVGQRFDVRIDRLARGGHGVGRLPSGTTVFVPFTAPQDVVSIEITTSKKSHSFGKIISILKASPHREEPRCKVFQTCGGCAFQNVNYNIQLLEKLNILKHALRHFLSESQLDHIQMIPSPKVWNYRNRIQPTFLGNSFGFTKRGTNEFIQFDRCEIAEEKINENLEPLRNSNIDKGRYEAGVDQSGEFYFVKSQSQRSESVFSQVNSGLNDILLTYVTELISTYKSGRILELYCASGNFTHSYSSLDSVSEVYASDIDKNAILKAKSEPDKNIHFVAESALTTLEKVASNYDLVLVDPPRTGFESGMTEKILKHDFKKVIYVSCDPMTLQRDLKPLIQSNYEIQSIRGFDMFPHTDHMETVVTLESGASR